MLSDTLCGGGYAKQSISLDIDAPPHQKPFKAREWIVNFGVRSQNLKLVHPPALTTSRGALIAHPDPAAPLEPPSKVLGKRDDRHLSSDPWSEFKAPISDSHAARTSLRIFSKIGDLVLTNANLISPITFVLRSRGGADLIQARAEKLGLFEGSTHVSALSTSLARAPSSTSTME
ncbi:hypothetical protein K438DRAFT_1779310 [Mycena galopus ATCC 62051]|nr:hypothetical protein K438DRAFT_1779310 [Mycena galopus ATCC 62051]